MSMKTGKAGGPEQREAAAILRELEALGNPVNVAGMARYGIRSAQVLGVPAPVVRARAKALGRNHELAAALWQTGVLEARLMAALVDEPAKVTRGQMEAWARDFDSWALCDGACSILFDRTPFAVEKAHAWSRRRAEYVKRAGFVLMAALAVHDKRAPDEVFRDFLPVIERESGDERNFVKKAVNWALRQVGKRNAALHVAAIETCGRLRASRLRSARWIAADALRELTDDKTMERLQRRRRGATL